MSVLELIYPVGSIVFGTHPKIGEWELLPRGYVIETIDDSVPTTTYMKREKQIISADCLTKTYVETNETGLHKHANSTYYKSHKHSVSLPQHTHPLSLQNVVIEGKTEETFTDNTSDVEQYVSFGYKVGTNQGWVWVVGTGKNSSETGIVPENGEIVYDHIHKIQPTDVEITKLTGRTDSNSELIIETSQVAQEIDSPDTLDAGVHKHVVTIGKDEPDQFYNKSIMIRSYIRIK